MEIADPHVRLQKRLRSGDNDLHVCTLDYRPPDVLFGNKQFQEDLGMWSFGCVAAEIYSRRILIASAATAKQGHSPKQFVEAIAATVPSLRNSSRLSCPASWLEQLPFFKKWCGCSGQEGTG